MESAFFNMEEKKPVYCMHCERWYAQAKADQCNIRKNETEEIEPSIIGFRALTKNPNMVILLY